MSKSKTEAPSQTLEEISAAKKECAFFCNWRKVFFQFLSRKTSGFDVTSDGFLENEFLRVFRPELYRTF